MKEVPNGEELKEEGYASLKTLSIHWEVFYTVWECPRTRV